MRPKHTRACWIRSGLLLAALVAGRGAAIAQGTPPDPQRLAAARELIEAQGGVDQARKAYDQMMGAMAAEVGRRNPGEIESFKKFVGTHIGPDSALVTRFFNETLEASVAFYAEHCSIEELQAITAFLKSPAGLKLTRIAPEATTVMVPKLIQFQQALAAEIRGAIARGELKN